MLYNSIILSELPAVEAQLTSLATLSLKNGFRPATLAQYTRMWKDFLAFQVAAGLPLHQVPLLVLLAYIQYLISTKHFK